MAVYNGEKYIRQAIDSALSQSFGDFELLIIDDGSTDSSMEIIRQYNDRRIRVLRNEKNMGLFETRNRGVEEARGEYFATLDCDDIAPSHRLATQLKCFSRRPDSAVCSGRIILIDENSRRIGKALPMYGDQSYFKSLLLFTNYLYNSTTMIRLNVLRELKYRPGYEPAEDFDLFERIMRKYPAEYTNKVLSYYRVHGSNVSSRQSERREKAERIIIERQLSGYGFSFTAQELDLQLNFTRGTFDFDATPPALLAAWLRSLKQQNKERNILPEKAFNRALLVQWLRVCKTKLKKNGDPTPLFNSGLFSLAEWIRLL